MLMHTNHNAELVLWIGSWRQCLSLQKFLAMLSQRTYSGLFICLRTFDDILCEAFVRLFVLFVCCKAIALASLLKQHKVFKFEKIWSSHLPLPCLKWLFCARQVGRLVGNAEGGSLRYPSTPVRGRNPALLCHALLHPAHWVCNAKDPAYPRFAACTERKNEIYGWAERVIFSSCWACGIAKLFQLIQQEQNTASASMIHSYKSIFLWEREGKCSTHKCLLVPLLLKTQNEWRQLYTPDKPGSVKATKNLSMPTKKKKKKGKITFWTSLAFATLSVFCSSIFSIAWRPLLIVSAFPFSTYWGELCKFSKLICHSKEKMIVEITKIHLFLCTSSLKILEVFLCSFWWVT